MEHQEYLGNTLAKIAREKAGIIKKNAGIVTGTRQKSALKVIEQVATEKEVPLYRLGKEIRVRKNKEGSFTYLGFGRRWPQVKIGMIGDHQVTNAALALGALELLQKKGVYLTDEAVYAGLAATRWPGRLEVFSRKPFILLDGAHNPSAVRTLKKFLENSFSSRRLTMVVGILEDKAWKPMLRDLAGVANRIILTRPQYERAADPHKLAAFLRPLKQDLVVIPKLSDAISFAIKETNKADAVCITGSLYTVGDARVYLEGAHAPC
jgi:dihydrofolate synthase / folylpolyglutamate synthase